MHWFRQHPHLSVFAAALLVRLVYLAESLQHPAFLLPLIDAATYDNFARQWVTLGLRDSTTAWHAAFYPLFLSALYRIFGPSVLAAKLVQLLLGALACTGMGALARRVFGPRAGWWAGLLAACYGPLVFYDLELMSAGWSVAWCTLMVGVLSGAGPAGRGWRGLWHGVLIAVALLIRPELSVAYVGAMALETARTRSRPSARTALVAAAAIALILLPVGLMNRAFTGRWSVLPANSGLQLYLTNNRDPYVSLLDRPGPDYDRVVQEPRRAGYHALAEQNQYFHQRARTELTADPLRTARRFGQKLLLLLSGREIISDVDPYSARESSRLLSVLIWKTGRYGFPFALLLGLAALGLGTPRRVPWGPALWFGLLLTAALLIYLPALRYRLILLPLLIPLAGAGADRLWSAVRERRTASLARQLAILLGAALLSTTPGLASTEHTNFRAERYRMIGQRLDQPGGTNGWLDQAWALQPGDPQTAFFLALNAVQAGQPERARALLDLAVAAVPDYSMALLLRADLKAEAGDDRGARDDLLQALRADPDQVDVLLRLGLHFAQAGEPARARAYFEQALQQQPGHPVARMHLAGVLIDLGEAGRAQVMLDDLLRADPHNAQLQFNAGRAALLLGQPTRARQHLQEVLLRQPDHAAARALLETTIGAPPGATP